MTKEQQRTLEIAVCGYLPYGLKFKYFCPYDHDNDRIGTIDGIDSLPNLHFFDENGSRVQIRKTCMPLLRPLSDLTATITHNGESFVPIELLVKGREVVFENGSFWYLKTESIVTGPEKWCGAEKQIELFDKLNEWFIDYRGLISQSLAISVHDLPENPYL